MKRNSKQGSRKSEPRKGQDAFRQDISVQQWDELAKEADKSRSRKPGSQGSGSGRHNNGRGGGK